MRYPPEHKARAREKLVRTSASLAKREGFGVSGVDALAKAGGVTSGAFYKHFEGKDQLLSAIVETELATTCERFAALDGSREQVLFAIDAYLSLAHVRHPESGCVLPSLASEVARASSDTRSGFERALAELTAVLAEKVGDASIANALVSLCAGAVMIARSLATDAAKRGVLDAARKGARAILGAE
ncbi:MAG: TetR/AcrR family transcriptional regulator [Polyangiales bacterium]